MTKDINDSENNNPQNPEMNDQEPREEESIFDRVMPDKLKRGIETFLREGRVKTIVGDFKLPKEIISHTLSQIDETKDAALGVISREVREFLENTNLSDELAKLLTQITFEVKTEVRFKPSDSKKKHNKKKDTEEEPAEPLPQEAETTPLEESKS